MFFLLACFVHSLSRSCVENAINDRVPSGVFVFICIAHTMRQTKHMLTVFTSKYYCCKYFILILVLNWIYAFCTRSLQCLHVLWCGSPSTIRFVIHILFFSLFIWLYLLLVNSFILRLLLFFFSCVQKLFLHVELTLKTNECCVYKRHSFHSQSYALFFFILSTTKQYSQYRWIQMLSFYSLWLWISQ